MKNHTPYFKCHLCPKAQVAKCVHNKLQNNKLLCTYGTGLSIWKWIIRSLTCICTLICFIGPIYLYIWGWLHTDTLEQWNLMLSISWVTLNIGVIIFSLIFIISNFQNWHNKFKAAGGKYFG